MGEMAARITRIEKNRIGKRWKVELDDAAWLTLETTTMQALGLCEGMDVDPYALYEQALELEKNAARERALAMLGYRDRSRREIEMDLKRRGYHEQAIAYAVERLEEYRYVDDKRLAQGMLETGRGQLSKNEIRQRMRSRGVEAEAIDEAFSGLMEEDEEEAALAEARRRLRGKDPTPEALKKAVDALARKGFSYGLARRVVRRVCGDEHNLDDDWEPYP